MAKRKATGRQTASNRAYEAARDLIASGEFKVGERVTEGALASRLEVSRTPVREAMQRLASEGFIELSPHAGALVKGWSERDVRDVFEVRAHLESMAAGRAARRRSAEDVERLVARCNSMEALSLAPADIPAMSEQNRAFHADILEIGGNRRLADIALNLMDLGFLVRSFSHFAQENILRSASDHRCLVEAIRQGDDHWAEAVMRGHILAAASIFTGTESATQERVFARSVAADVNERED